MRALQREHRAVAVVTGAGTGLGRALALEMSQRGVSVAVLGRTLANLETTAGLATGAPVVPFEVDVGDNNAVVAAFATLRGKLGEPTILINNAAVYPRQDFLAGTPEEFMECVATNLGGAVNCAHAALLSMTSTGRGRIINVGSFADISPQPMAAAYSVSKGAVGAFSRALVADLGDRFPDIIVSTWMPGILATQMGLASGLNPAIAARWGAELALSNDRDLNGAVFERDLQIMAPRSFKRRMLEKILRRSTKVRRLAPASAEQIVESQAG